MSKIKLKVNESKKRRKITAMEYAVTWLKRYLQTYNMEMVEVKVIRIVNERGDIDFEVEYDFSAKKLKQRK